jgi:hypothetical protein
MNLKELDSFKISDAVTFHDKLNPKLWNGTKLRPEVKQQLEAIADDFLQEMGIHELDVRDITISGSNAAYSYTDHSDLDLHILVNVNDLPSSDVYKELFQAKKTIYNDTHNITIHKVPVELYVQDASEPVVSLGEYSIKNDSWIKIPTKRRSNFDQNATKAKHNKLLDIVERAIESNNLNKIQKVLKKIKQYRQAGLDKGGEFGPENLAYKALRSQGYITKLYDLRDKLHSNRLSIEGMYSNMDEDYDPNGPPPGPEFKPTMPAGTVKVDVSDVYDWYKLGQHISNLKGLGKHDFGKGPPSTILAFGDEDTEHKYIDALQKTGLTTTDIDPFDPKQPKGMKRQKVDPTYNVNETFNKPYSITWEKSEYGDYDALATLDDGTYLSISFEHVSPYEVAVSFWRNNSQEVTGEGDAQRVFATVLAAVQQFLKQEQPANISFSAVKEDDPSGSRSKLYSKLVQRYAANWGYQARSFEHDDKVEFELSKINKNVKEDETMQYAAEKTPPTNPYGGLRDNQYRGSISEASGYIPSEKEKNDPRFKTALTVDVKPDSIKKNAKAFSWLTDRAGIPPTLKASGKF